MENETLDYIRFDPEKHNLTEKEYLYIQGDPVPLSEIITPHENKYIWGMIGKTYSGNAKYIYDPQTFDMFRKIEYPDTEEGLKAFFDNIKGLMITPYTSDIFDMVIKAIQEHKELPRTILIKAQQDMNELRDSLYERFEEIEDLEDKIWSTRHDLREHKKELEKIEKTVQEYGKTIAEK